MHPRLSGARRGLVPACLALTLTALPLGTAFLASPASAATCTIRGTAGPDRLVGTSRADVICGLGGNDKIYGLGGNDTLVGGDGNDYLSDGAGTDKVLGGAGNDTIVAGSGTDSYDGGTGRDRVSYAGRPAVTVKLDGHDNDGVTGEKDHLVGLEDISGGSGDDVLTGSAEVNRINGGAGSDLINGRGGADLVDGGTSTGMRDACLLDKADTRTNCVADRGAPTGTLELTSPTKPLIFNGNKPALTLTAQDVSGVKAVALRVVDFPDENPVAWCPASMTPGSTTPATTSTWTATCSAAVDDPMGVTFQVQATDRFGQVSSWTAVPGVQAAAAWPIDSADPEVSSADAFPDTITTGQTFPFTVPIDDVSGVTAPVLHWYAVDNLTPPDLACTGPVLTEGHIILGRWTWQCTAPASIDHSTEYDAYVTAPDQQGNVGDEVFVGNLVVKPN